MAPVPPKTPKTRAEKLRDLLALLGTDNAGERNNARRKIFAFLKKQGQALADFAELSVFDMLGIDDDDEREKVRQRILASLKQRGQTWNHAAENWALAYEEIVKRMTAPPPDPRDTGPAPDLGANITPADLIRHVLEQYVALADSHEYVAVTLWVLHTHVYDQFMLTPRLVLTSPVWGCGKSLLLKVGKLLVARPRMTHNITAAGIYAAVDRDRCTFLNDETDNLDLAAKGALRAVINGGYERGAVITRNIGGRSRDFLLFTPMALASIGIVPLPLMSRSIVIHMTRGQPLRRFDLDDVSGIADIDLAYRQIMTWVRSAAINRDPEMPMGLGRPADNWRPLIAVADACSPAWGDLARKAAIHFACDYHNDDAAVFALDHTRTIFNIRGVDRIYSEVLVGDLNAMDDAYWYEWCGVRGDQQPHRLTQHELARLFSAFKIRPKSIWPPARKPNDRSKKGYFRSQFESAWHDYCDQPGTPAQSKKIKALFGP
jgi:hypothetical protein